MNDRHRTDGTDAAEPAPPPTECPACRSATITTTGKVANTQSYWRCLGCGEVWNVGRRGQGRYRPFGSYAGQR